ncbi:MAG: hypothetical protein QG591_1254 [Planctomycetota bacterium]|nr:hypothetical protein [Planctomycetota bacterium]
MTDWLKILFKKNLKTKKALRQRYACKTSSAVRLSCIYSVHGQFQCLSFIPATNTNYEYCYMTLYFAPPNCSGFAFIVMYSVVLFY